MPRDWLIAIGGGLMSAVAAVAFFGGSVFSLLFVYFASVPLLMVGLGLGPRAITIAAGAGVKFCKLYVCNKKAKPLDKIPT